MTLATISNVMAMDFFKLFSSISDQNGKKSILACSYFRPQPGGMLLSLWHEVIILFHCTLLHIFSTSTKESYESLRPKWTLLPTSHQCASWLSERQADPGSPFEVTPFPIPCQPLLLTAFQYRLTPFHGQHESLMDWRQTLKNNIISAASVVRKCRS